MTPVEEGELDEGLGWVGWLWAALAVGTVTLALAGLVQWFR